MFLTPSSSSSSSSRCKCVGVRKTPPKPNIPSIFLIVKPLPFQSVISHFLALIYMALPNTTFFMTKKADLLQRKPIDDNINRAETYTFPPNGEINKFRASSLPRNRVMPSELSRQIKSYYKHNHPLNEHKHFFSRN